MRDIDNKSILFQQPETKQNIAYKKLKEMILTCELPEDRFLVERQLSETLGISRTPIRAALNDLCAEGLVVNYPGRGMVVSSVTIEDVVEIYQIRHVLDEMAFREVLENNDPNVIGLMRFHTAEMKKYIEKGENEKCVEHDMAFHDCYYLNIHNQRLSKMLFSLRDQIRRFLNFTVGDDERIPLTYQEHKSIMDAVEANNVDEACERLVYHLYQARDYHLNRIHKAISIRR